MMVRMEIEFSFLNSDLRTSSEINEIEPKRIRDVPTTKFGERRSATFAGDARTCSSASAQSATFFFFAPGKKFEYDALASRSFCIVREGIFLSQ